MRRATHRCATPPPRRRLSNASGQSIDYYQSSPLATIPNLIGPFSDTEEHYLLSQTLEIYQYLRVARVDKSKPREMNRAQASIQKVLKTISKFSSRIEESQIALGRERALKRLKQTSQKGKFNNDYKNQKYILKVLKYITQIELIDLHAQYYNVMMVNLILIQTMLKNGYDQGMIFYVDLDKSSIKAYLNGFPNDSKSRRIEKAIDVIKNKKKNVRKFTNNDFLQMEQQMLDLQIKSWDNKIQYFKDFGTIENIFLTYINNCSIDYLKEKLVLAYKLIEQKNDTVGKAILHVTEFFMENITIKNEKSTSAYFILFARYFFSELYQNVLWKKIFGYPHLIGKISLLRKYSTDLFPVPKQFFTPKFLTIPLENIPKSNDYEPVINILKVMTFQYCPIDFCYYAYNAIQRLQQIASNISFSEKVKSTGQMVPEHEHELSTDDIIDVLFILWLISGSLDLGSLVKSFEPYINGLMLPQELQFAFISFKMAWLRLEDINVDDFLDHATQKQKDFIENDPLGILDS